MTIQIVLVYYIWLLCTRYNQTIINSVCIGTCILPKFQILYFGEGYLAHRSSDKLLSSKTGIQYFTIILFIKNTHFTKFHN